VRALAGAVLVLVATGCTVDTEIGVGAEIQSVALTVRGVAPDTEIDLEMPVVFRVGEHATGPRQFQINGIDVRVGDGDSVAFLAPAIPATFSGRLAPAEEQTLVLGADPEGSNVTDRARDVLCAGGAMATAVLVYRHRDAETGGELDWQPDMTSAGTSNILCP
jgi:hypothetical protein